jgi:hypothetical protein
VEKMASLEHEQQTPDDVGNKNDSGSVVMHFNKFSHAARKFIFLSRSAYNLHRACISQSSLWGRLSESLINETNR